MSNSPAHDETGGWIFTDDAHTWMDETYIRDLGHPMPILSIKDDIWCTGLCGDDGNCPVERFREAGDTSSDGPHTAFADRMIRATAEELDDITFLTADEIAQQLGIPLIR